jgi:hypothetical protein
LSKKRVNKTKRVKQEEVKQEEGSAVEQPEKIHPLAAWDDLIFMRRQPKSGTDDVADNKAKGLTGEEGKNKGWSWI